MDQEWREGFPKHTECLFAYYLFEVLLSKTPLENEKIVEAYVRGGKWHIKQFTEIDSSLISGWRETYGCLDAKRAIDEFVRKSGFGISKYNFADAICRHIRMDSDEFISCEVCWNYYLEKSGEKNNVLTPEKLLEHKKIQDKTLTTAS